MSGCTRDAARNEQHAFTTKQAAYLDTVLWALGREKPVPDEARNEPARLPGLLVVAAPVHDVRDGDGVQGEETILPLRSERQPEW